MGTADRLAISFTHKEIRYSVEITDLSWHCEILLATNNGISIVIKTILLSLIVMVFLCGDLTQLENSRKDIIVKRSDSNLLCSIFSGYNLSQSALAILRAFLLISLSLRVFISPLHITGLPAIYSESTADSVMPKNT